ncbi:hypothetical protein ACOAJ8_05275 [Arcobacter cryaerophilus gv. pseudocryaerophilus]
MSQDEITIFTEDSNYSDKKLSIPIDEFYKILESNLELKTSRQMAKVVFGGLITKVKGIHIILQ